MVTNEPTVFISYRRGDTSLASSRLYEHLAKEFGARNVFLDIDSLPLGRPFPEMIARYIARSDVVLVLIGDRWNIRRLHDTSDWVRLEIEEALRSGATVIPVTVEDVDLPDQRDLPEAIAGLVAFNGAKLRVPPDWQGDVVRLIQGIREVVDMADTAVATVQSSPAASSGPKVERRSAAEPVPVIDVGCKVLDLVWSPDGGQLGVVGNSAVGQIRNVATAVSEAVLSGHRGWIRSVAWAPDGSEVATAGHDGVLRTWGCSDWRLRRSQPVHDGWALVSRWSPDGLYLATGGNDGTVRVVNAISMTQVSRFQGNSSWVRSVCWQGDGAGVIAAHDDGTLGASDMASGELIAAVTAHQDRVTSVARSPDGNKIASSSRDGSVRLWSAGDLGPQGELLSGDEPIHALAWCPNTSRLAVVGGHGLVRLIDTTGSQAAEELDGHGGSVLAAAWAKDGSHLATGGEDQTVRIWSTLFDTAGRNRVLGNITKSRSD